jgi:hypothetical protein
MRDPDRREPLFREAQHALPVQAAALAATPKRPIPVPDRHEPEGVDALAVAGHGVVREMPTHHASQPAALLGDGQMSASHQLGVDLAQLRPHPLRFRDPLELKAPVLGLPADMRKTQKPERLRLAESRFCRRSAANLPNSIRRLFSAASSKLNFASLS